VSTSRDHSARQRFAEELDRNFSVVASAGSGKTQAITERIVHLARSRDALEILPKLVVVTFTNRAADEMQQRTRQRILAEHRSSEIQIAFNRAFFGTIHSFCLKLLTNYGHYLGLPSPLDLVAENDEELWEAFVSQYHHIGRSLDNKTRTALFRLAPARQLMELGRNARLVLTSTIQVGSCPVFDFSEVHAAIPPPRSEETMANSKAELADWERRYRSGWEFVRWPVQSCHAREFTERWRAAFAPLRAWVADAALCVAAEVQRDFRNFRIERGLVTYADQVALADELLQHPAAARRMREEGFRVILDEAQDTDPAQFSVLTEVTRPPDATGRWLDTGSAPPRPGHFCMVGDFQQSIYRDRADLNNYRAIHGALVRVDPEAELEFSVTFRLDLRQLEFVNETFSEILNDQDGQVQFVELQARPDVLPGQVIRVSLEAGLLPVGEKLRDYQKAKIEAAALASWIKTTGLAKLRANTWRDVAILCPRKLWLRTMATALRRLELPVAMQSESDLKGDNPAYAWLAALCVIMVDPQNSYEIVGILREVFGIADHDLAIFSEGEGSRFQIEFETSSRGVVSSPLRLLAETRKLMQGRALLDALRILVDRTELRQKLRSLPAEEFGDLQGELDTLLATTAEAEARGATLTDFTEKLRLECLLQRDVRLSTDEGIQLITAQKAKGSEWQAVILPFLGRGVIPPSPRYPCILKIPRSNEPLVALTKDDFLDEVRAATKTAARQEMARLLYVATTRARHTLVLVDDRDLFANSKNAIPPTAQLKHFAPNERSTDTPFRKIGVTAEVCARTEAAQAAARQATVDPTLEMPLITRTERRRAAQHSVRFVHKFNPSGYDRELLRASADWIHEIASSMGSEGPIADTAATRYGRWWHELMQEIAWHDESSWKQLFEKNHAKSPAMKRSANEWDLFLRCVKNIPDFRERLTRREVVAHSEMPFLWRIDAATCFEGVIDLAFFDPANRSWLILDWKTNRITPKEADQLRIRYRPQIAAYWRAVTQMTGATVAAGIYSTAIGELIPYDSAELAEEWELLRGLTSDDLATVVVADQDLNTRARRE
jgi:ATP-dependent exoDNAse (exonuclease V) beta subunit